MMSNILVGKPFAFAEAKVRNLAERSKSGGLLSTGLVSEIIIQIVSLICSSAARYTDKCQEHVHLAGSLVSLSLRQREPTSEV